MALVVESVPLDVTDLPGYAARLARGNAGQPDILRLATWNRLEKGSSPAVQAARESNRGKIEQIACAQEDGVLPRRFAPAVLLALVLQISAVWAEAPSELADAGNWPGLEDQVAAVADAVRALVAPQGTRASAVETA